MLLRYPSRLIGLYSVKKIHQHKDPEADKLAYAITKAIKHRYSDQERNWITKIEDMRNLHDSDLSLLREIESDSINSPKLKITENSIGFNDQLSVSETSKSSTPQFWASILFFLIRGYQPETVIELGTCLGISASSQAAAMKLNGHGKIYSLEGNVFRALKARKTFSQLDLNNVEVVIGRFNKTLPNTVQSKSPIGFAFIDGNHREKPTLEYFEQFLPHLSDTAILVFDDISYSEEMKRAWAKIIKHDSIKISINLRTYGICLIDQKLDFKKDYTIPLF